MQAGVEAARRRPAVRGRLPGARSSFEEVEIPVEEDAPLPSFTLRGRRGRGARVDGRAAAWPRPGRRRPRTGSTPSRSASPRRDDEAWVVAATSAPIVAGRLAATETYATAAEAFVAAARARRRRRAARGGARVSLVFVSVVRQGLSRGLPIGRRAAPRDLETRPLATALGITAQATLGTDLAPPVACSCSAPPTSRGWTPAIVLRTDPPAGAQRVDTTLFPLIELDLPGLPWMFTPLAAADGRLRPWIALVVVVRRRGTRRSTSSRCGAAGCPCSTIERRRPPAADRPDVGVGARPAEHRRRGGHRPGRARRADRPGTPARASAGCCGRGGCRRTATTSPAWCRRSRPRAWPASAEAPGTHARTGVGPGVDAAAASCRSTTTGSSSRRRRATSSRRCGACAAPTRRPPPGGRSTRRTPGTR